MRILAKAKSLANNGSCPLTGESTFAQAIARVLDPMWDDWQGIVNVAVHRTDATGVISYKEGMRAGASSFAGPKQRAQTPTRLRVDATLTRDLIFAIKTDLKKAVDTEQRVRSAALEGIAGSEDHIRPNGRRHNRNLQQRGKKR